MDATEIALTAAENLSQLDGHEGWKPTDIDGHDEAHWRGESGAYIEICDAETGEIAQIYLIAARKSVEPPAFDDGAAADRAHETRVADESGAL